MAQLQTATLHDAHPRAPYWAVHIATPQPPGPGQFVLADLGGPIREPLFPAACQDDGFSVLVRPGHPVRQFLPGAELSLLGPLGRGFRVAGAERLLLIADVDALPPLLPLMHQTTAVTLLIAARTRAQLPPPHTFPPHVEVQVLTVDGSAGYRGTLTEPGKAPLTALIQWAERVCVACDPAHQASLARRVREARLQPRHDFAQVLVRSPMPCGVGACDVCRVETRRGERHACTDGPVFDLLALT